jgi:hypothetical protein
VKAEWLLELLRCAAEYTSQNARSKALMALSQAQQRLCCLKDGIDESRLE